MEALLYIKPYNSNSYDKIDLKNFSTLPRTDEFISIQLDGIKYFQIIAVLHHADQEAPTEIFAIQTEPTWELRKSGNIGFSF